MAERLTHPAASREKSRNAIHRGVAALGRRTLEIGLSMGMVLVFFSLFLAILNAILPTGTSTRALLVGASTGSASSSPASGGDRRILADGLVTGSRVALLSNARNDAKAKGSNTIVWSAAAAGLDLMDHHAVQTFKNSSARIAFDDDNELDVMQNTLIVIRRKDSSLLAQSTRSYSLTVDGELRGRLASGGATPVEIEVTLPTGVARVRASSEQDAPAEFNIKVNKDKSATVTVEKGEAEVISQGKTVTVAANQYTRMEEEMPPQAPRVLSPSPRPSTPPVGSVFTYRELAPRIEFGWTSPDILDGYRLVIARDSEFQNVVFDRVVPEPRFTHGKLEAGKYFWRVSGVRDDDEVTARGTGRFSIVKDQGPPPLEVFFPTTVLETDHFLLKGRTDPGIRISVDGLRVETRKDGSFEIVLKLDRGLNSIVVEAVDTAGNVAYRSEMVSAKY